MYIIKQFIINHDTCLSIYDKKNIIDKLNLLLDILKCINNGVQGDPPTKDEVNLFFQQLNWFGSETLGFAIGTIQSNDGKAEIKYDQKAFITKYAVVYFEIITFSINYIENYYRLNIIGKRFKGNRFFK